MRGVVSNRLRAARLGAARRAPRSPAGMLLAVALGLSACGGSPAAPTEAPVAPSPTESASPEPVAVAALARAVVQIVSYVDDEPYASGSGTVITPDGLILTNAHVVFPEEGRLDRLEIGITDSSDARPEPTFLAEVAAADGALDLAVLKITERIDGEDVSSDLAHVQIGDSDDLEIGDPVRILGYPGIGGETITLTSGQVSGFVGEAGLGQRAWVKTDATIAGGNSGGLAANQQGELIAVPTVAGATDEVVDCRPVRDTNRDGSVNDEDDCVPIGGFLNGLRPVALALDMIDAVESGVAYEPIAEVTQATEPDDLDDVSWTDPVFGAGVTADDEPIGKAIGFDPGTTSICAFWDYQGMQAGMRWSAEWSVDGRLDEDASFTGERWSLEDEGRFWVCIEDDSGLAEGVYDVALLVEDVVLSTGFAHVTDDLSTGTVNLHNAGDEAICYLYASPVRATVWGTERLGAGTVLASGDEVSFELIGGHYDILAEGCDEEELFLESIEVVAGSAIELAWSPEGGLTADGIPVSEAAELQVGDCLNGEVGWNRLNTDVVPCSSPHIHEIVGVIPFPSGEGSFPGDAALEALGDEECHAAFEGFVGMAYESSIWYMTAWHPTAETWRAGDRTVICTLHHENEEPITGSRRDAAE